MDFWNNRLRQTLRSYDEPILRLVAGKLCKPRNQWPAEELIERSLATFTNPPVLDRRIKEQDAPARQILALISHSKQERWPVGALVEMLFTLGFPDGLAPVRALLDTGLLYPELPENARLKSFEQWLGQGQAPVVFAHPAVLQRAVGEPFTIAQCPGAVDHASTAHEADGLEWPLRLAVLWQQVSSGPLRRTQSRDFFKRDLDRLRGDSVLGTPPSDSLAELPDPALCVVALALALGILEEKEGELRAGAFPPPWSQGLAETVENLWAGLPRLECWNPALGWEPGALGNPYPGVNLLALRLLAQLPDDAWADPVAIDRWLHARHPFWQGGAKDPKETCGATTFLLAVAYPLRLVQACKGPDEVWRVRLSALGQRALGLSSSPETAPSFPQTLLVQPNLEILAYRQGLNPGLIVRLSRFAAWKGLGAACTLQLEPDCVYRALEAGETFASIVQTLERHGMKALPDSVLDMLKTWSNKRERISVYPSAALFEFSCPTDLHEAFSRGLPAIRLTDRLAVVPNESQIDYKHYRLTGTRDYCLPPERCVEVEADGVTLTVDLARSDLLLESEVTRFAEPLQRSGWPGRRYYRLTPASLALARERGLGLAFLETWFVERTGLPISPAARLLYLAPELLPMDLRRQLLLHVTSADLADGLSQWPGTREFIKARVGPTALAVDEKDAASLQERLKELGVKLWFES